VINQPLAEPVAGILPNATAAPLPQVNEQLIEPKHRFDFRHFWHLVIERIWIVVLCVLAGLFLGVGYLAQTPKLYQGHTVLEVDFQEPTVVTSEQSALRMRSMFLASQ
jgi:uncharacterized protein involved in exopolysaccharide biosynthesis